jgi:hypothetical protein
VEGSLAFHEAINNGREDKRYTSKRKNRKKSWKREEFSASNSQPSEYFVPFVYFQVYFGYEALMDYVLLTVRSEMSPKMLKSSKWFVRKL